jgi:hypothetical protein
MAKDKRLTKIENIKKTKNKKEKNDEKNIKRQNHFQINLRQ